MSETERAEKYLKDYNVEDILISTNEGQATISQLLTDFSTTQNKEKWISVEDRPLIEIINPNGDWQCTKDGMNEFIGCVPYNDSTRPKDDLYWIRHCIIEDEIGLCVIGDSIITEPSGWEVEHVTHWMPLPTPPQNGTNNNLNQTKTQ